MTTSTNYPSQTDEYDEYLDYEDPKWVKRDRKNARKHGMRVSGRSIFTIVKVQAKKARRNE